MNIRKATEADATAVAAIIAPIIREGATYTLDPEMSEAEALAYWMGHDKETFVAEQDGVVLGTYYMRPNQAGGGRHVCNCGYMTDAAATGEVVTSGSASMTLPSAMEPIWALCNEGVFWIIQLLPRHRHPIQCRNQRY
jgi:hypothetical protein